MLRLSGLIVSAKVTKSGGCMVKVFSDDKGREELYEVFDSDKDRSDDWVDLRMQNVEIDVDASVELYNGKPQLKMFAHKVQPYFKSRTGVNVSNIKKDKTSTLSI